LAAIIKLWPRSLANLFHWRRFRDDGRVGAMTMQQMTRVLIMTAALVLVTLPARAQWSTGGRVCGDGLCGCLVEQCCSCLSFPCLPWAPRASATNSVEAPPHAPAILGLESSGAASGQGATMHNTLYNLAAAPKTFSVVTLRFRCGNGKWEQRSLSGVFKIAAGDSVVLPPQEGVCVSSRGEVLATTVSATVDAVRTKADADIHVPAAPEVERTPR